MKTVAEADPEVVVGVLRLLATEFGFLSVPFCAGCDALPATWFVTVESLTLVLVVPTLNGEVERLRQKWTY